jgi:Flp pilus assembly protein TadD
MISTTCRSRLLTSVAFAVLALSAAGCASNREEITGSVQASAQKSEGDWRRDLDTWGARYKKNTSDADAAVHYAQALRATGQRAQAVAVLEQAAIVNPKHTGVLGAYGRALADVGRYPQALDVFKSAHTPDQPDWRILSAQGAVLDQLGRHEEAQRYYASALRIVPDEPSILSNLGLSYALAKNLPKAEETLRRASVSRDAEPKVRQNLALVVGLQGRFPEAEDIARGDLSEEEALANVAYLRQMLVQKNDWKKLSSAQGPLKQAGRI